MQSKKHARLAQAGIFLFFLLLPVPLLAQSGTISGTITDESGSTVPDTAIKVTNVGTGLARSAQTDSSGTYSVPILPVGRYTASLSKTGFETRNFKDLELTVGQSLTLNATMRLAKVSTQVDVSAATTPTIDLDNAQLSNVVEQRAIQDLPLLTRDPYSLVLLSPGVEQSNSGLGGFSFNGQRERNNNFLLDGVDNNDASVPGISGGISALNPESTQEFRVISNNFLPEYGRNTGAIINVVTRGGTNQFHGSAYEFNRVNALAARDFFNPAPNPQDPFVRNDFGFSVGGPIRRDQTFFFVNSDWQRFITTLTGQAIVPTAAFKSGIFNYKGQTINLADPGSPNNEQRLPLDPSMQKVFAAYPNPNGPTVDSLRAIRYFPSASRALGASVVSRLDHRFSDKYSVFARYDYGTGADPNAFHDEQLPGIGGTSTDAQTQSGALNFIAAFRPSLVNEFRFGLNRLDDLFTCGGHNTIDKLSPLDQFGFGRDYLFETSTGVPTIADFACVPLTDSNAQFRRAGTWNWIDNLSWVHGSHNVKFGGEFRYVFENGYDAMGVRPQFDFAVNGFFGTNIVNCSLCANDEVLQTLGAALLGDGFQQQTQFFDAKGQRTATDFRRFRQHEYGAFLQDVWKILPNLTLQVGVRYEFDGVPFETSGNLSNAYQDVSAPGPVKFLTVGPGTGRQLFNNDSYDLEPRAGLSWDPFHDGKTAFRMGYGIFHDRIFGNLVSNLKGNPPFTGSAFEGSLTASTALAPATLPAPTNVIMDGDLVLAPITLIDPNLQTPYTQAWNAGVQRTLGWNAVLEVNYVGSSSHRLFRSVDGNPPLPDKVQALIASGVPENLLQGGALRFATYGQVTGNLAIDEPLLNKSIGNATYNGLQVTLTKRLTGGLEFQAAYTWSHAIDDAPDPIVNTAANRSIARNSFNLKEERGSSDFDLRHRLVVSYIYQLPFGKGHAYLNHGFSAALLGNWEVSGISTFESGRPFDLFTSEDPEHTGLSGRPDLMGDPAIPAGSDKTRTGPPASAFAPPPFGRPGNVGRNTFTGPRFFNTDVDLIKRIALTERANLQFRAEAYNVFNQVQLSQPGLLGTGQPGNVISNPGTFGISLSELGRSDGTSAARQIQLALKLEF